MPSRPFLTLDDLPLAGRTVFVRVDLNCPLDAQTRAPQLSPRVPAHARTVLDLASAGAKTVLLAHQGRKGDADFISLAGHAPMLAHEVGELARITRRHAPTIRFVDDVAGPAAHGAVAALAPGEVLLLQNVRELEDETKFEKNGGSSELVKRLGGLCEVFVLDAFSCAHRAHASVVGFSNCPVLAGRVMEQELGALGQFHEPAHPALFVMGGAKPDDSLPILRAWLEAGKLDQALTGGTMANLMLLAAGKDIGEPSRRFLQEKGALEHLAEAQALYAQYTGKIQLPEDVVVDAGGVPQVLPVRALPSPHPILDIGPVTASRYGTLLRAAGSVVMNGPMGVYEKEAFAAGTRAVLEAISQCAGFSLLGGGHTLSALDKFAIDRSRLGYVSLSGKALIEYLAGDKLPGVQLLEQSARKWRPRIEAGENIFSPRPAKKAKKPAARAKGRSASGAKNPGPATAKPASSSRAVRSQKAAAGPKRVSRSSSKKGLKKRRRA